MSNIESPTLKALRVHWWLYQVRAKSGETSPKHLELHFSPLINSIECKNGWYQYASGKREPSKRTQNQVDQRYLGCSQILHHPLWDALKLQGDTSKKKIDAIVHQVSENLQITFTSNFEFQPVMMRRLLRFESLDILAILVLYWNHAFARAESNNMYIVSRTIYRFLLMMEVNVCPISLQSELFRVFKEIIFDVSARTLGKCLTNVAIFMCSRRILHYSAYHAHYSSFESWLLDKRIMTQRLLNERKYDFGAELDIIYTQIWDFGAPSHDVWLACKEHQRKRVINWELLLQHYDFKSPKQFQFGGLYYRMKYN